jgi:putative sterol carrier protein
MTKTLQWNITGEEAGVWAFQIINGEGKLIPGGVEKPDITFTVSDKDWLAIAEGKLDAMNAFMTGKLKIAGDMMLGMKVPSLFPIPR